jgi:hypothetical protein
VDAAWEKALTDTWEGTGISLSMERPTVETAEPLRMDAWTQQFFNCLTYSHVAWEGMSSSDGGGIFLQMPGKTDAEKRGATELRFYECVAKHPQDMVADGTLFSDAQLDYIYDYYERWLIPCLATNHYQLRGDIPSRALFTELRGGWSPYWNLSPSIDSGRELDEIVAKCGPERPPLS